MKAKQLLLICVVSFIVTVVTLKIVPISNTPSVTVKESAFARTVQTGSLRCGYQYYDSGVMRDDKTGQVYGPDVDLMKAIGEAAGLKIEWVSQIGWDEVGAALKTQKIDAMCAGMWTAAAKAKEIAFTTPFAYQAIEAFVRMDDHRFDMGQDALNSTDVKIAVIDNDNSDFIAQQDFPKAQKVALGQMNGTDGDLLMSVMTNKGDVTFTSPGFLHEFNKTNPNKIRRLYPGTKLRVFGLSLAVNSDETHLLNVLNAGVQEIQNSGMLDKILDQANKTWPDMYIKPLKPFP